MLALTLLAALAAGLLNRTDFMQIVEARSFD